MKDKETLEKELREAGIADKVAIVGPGEVVDTVAARAKEKGVEVVIVDDPQFLDQGNGIKSMIPSHVPRSKVKPWLIEIDELSPEEIKREALEIYEKTNDRPSLQREFIKLRLQDLINQGKIKLV